MTSGIDQSATVQAGESHWEGTVHAAMHAAGLRIGDTVLHVGRYFSLRDAMKWARRMQVPFSHPGTPVLPFMPLG